LKNKEEIMKKGIRTREEENKIVERASEKLLDKMEEGIISDAAAPIIRDIVLFDTNYDVLDEIAKALWGAESELVIQEGSKAEINLSTGRARGKPDPRPGPSKKLRV
jgi:hypothetical protein